MEIGDVAEHGHEVYPSDVPSLGYPAGSRGSPPGPGKTAPTTAHCAQLVRGGRGIEPHWQRRAPTTRPRSAPRTIVSGAGGKISGASRAPPRRRSAPRWRSRSSGSAEAWSGSWRCRRRPPSIRPASPRSPMRVEAAVTALQRSYTRPCARRCCWPSWRAPPRGVRRPGGDLSPADRGVAARSGRARAAPRAHDLPARRLRRRARHRAARHARDFLVRHGSTTETAEACACTATPSAIACRASRRSRACPRTSPMVASG